MPSVIRTEHGRRSVARVDGFAEFAAQYLSGGKNFQTISVKTAARSFGTSSHVTRPEAFLFSSQSMPPEQDQT
jgi:hypothetical protein